MYLRDRSAIRLGLGGSLTNVNAAGVHSLQRSWRKLLFHTKGTPTGLPRMISGLEQE